MQVIKRNGETADFTLTKISDAIRKAFDATQMHYTNDVVDLLALRVTADFQARVKDDAIHVEDIQDSVERVLGQAGYEEAAKAYILYRKQREKMRTMTSTILDYKEVVNGRGLARQGKFHRHLFRRRADLKQFRGGNGKLLAFRNL